MKKVFFTFAIICLCLVSAACKSGNPSADNPPAASVASKAPVSDSSVGLSEIPTTMKAQPSIVAGNASKGKDDGDAASASFNEPCAILAIGDALLVADTGNNIIRLISESTVSTYAGQMLGYDIYNTAVNGYKDALCNKALFAKPCALLNVSGGILVLDSGNNAIRLIADGKVTTLAGEGSAGYSDGTFSTALFNNPRGFCSDPDGNVYIADTGNNLIRKLDTKGNVTTYAGCIEGGYLDGKAEASLFNSPTDVEFFGNTLYVADSANNRIRAISNGKVSTLAGCGTDKYENTNEYIGDYIDGKQETAYFNMPTGITVGSDGALYIADSNNSAIRKIKDGMVQTITGFCANDDETGVSLICPQGIYCKGNVLYVTDSFKNTIVKVVL